ncbi:MAG: FG-GAP repeat protein [Myxococcales bacterium]|nr:FG-GAP repeat protein [Myxococcales bacterium]
MVRTVFGVLAFAAVACRIPEKVPLATDAADDAATTDAIVLDAASDAAATDAPSVDAPPIDAGGCGDGTRTGTEVCDGVDLGGQSCQTQGFASGTLACAASCAAYDLVGCDAPTAPVLRRPLANAYVGLAHNAGSMRPTFEWAAPAWSGTGSLSYEIDLSTDSTFASGVTTATATTTSFRPAADLAVSMTAPVGARYFWRVRACFRGRCSLSTGGRLLNIGRSGRDLNGDGYADVVVGGPAAGAGRAYVFMGRQGGGVEATPDGTLTAGSAGDVFGAVAIPGDLNGDGFADLAVGAYRFGATDTGRVYVYFGGAGATFNTGVDATISGTSANAQLNAAAGGDVNGDGYADLVVGSSEYPTGPGSVYVYLGGPGAFNTTSDARFTGAVAGDEQGSSVAVGDVNGDGYADVVAGAPNYDGTSTGVGAAYVYLGSALPIDTTADGTLVGGAMQDYFGMSVACGGDVNGDGFDDVVVGAHEQDTDGASAGRAYVFYGGAAAFDTTPDGILLGPATGHT